ncbi:MAG: hypothetical protein CME06_16625 [Gemmatimonadetes bacterium]|nr:hypothetical protein [Gemmatimonadota bacterium]
MLIPFSLAFGIAFIASLAATPMVRRVASWLGAVDHPGGRRVHQRAVPRLGGVAIFAAYFAGETAAWLAVRWRWIWPAIDRANENLLFPGHAHLRRILAVSAAALLLGLVDDLWNVGGGMKFVLQLLIAGAALALGFRIYVLSSPLGGSIALGLWGIPITVAWIMTLMNAVNLVDGVDGLAGGMVVIASLALFAISVLRGNLEAALLLTGLTGAALGFLKWNLHPATVFMGDSGSLFLGTALALITIVANFKSAAAIALIIPMVVLLVPLTEIVVTTMRRAVARRPIFEADRNHLHHQLLNIGLSTPQTVTILYSFAACAGLVAVALVHPDRRLRLLVFAALIATGTVVLRVVARTIAGKGAGRAAAKEGRRE